MAVKLANSVNIRPRMDEIKSNSGKDYVIADIRKIMSFINWRPQISISEGLALSRRPVMERI